MDDDMNIAVTFRQMLPDEDLLTRVREGCRQLGANAWSVFVEAQKNTTRVQLVRDVDGETQRVEATHHDRFMAFEDALAQLDSHD